MQMKTARVATQGPAYGMSPTTTGTFGTPASESAIDAYATRVLHELSPPETAMDDSVGPYVTSVLRCCEILSEDQVTSVPEFESLCEFLEDQCAMTQDVATSALKKIAQAVITGTFPQDVTTSAHTSGGLYSLGGTTSLDSFRSIKDSLPPIFQSAKKSDAHHSSIDPYTPNPAGGPSPLKPDNLIPLDLLGVLDDAQEEDKDAAPAATAAASAALESPPKPSNLLHQALQQHQHQMHQHQQLTQQQHQQQHQQQPSPTSAEEAFPPLGAQTTTSNKIPIKKGRKSKGNNKSKNSDKELAASLFRPSRPRQNSIESEDAHGHSPSLTSASKYPNNASAANRNPNDFYFQQKLDSCVEILLSMNTELSEAAAADAALLANTDINVAQFVVDSALSASPICRHMLHEGCYRSDCQFSHDVESHTCLFWLRGRCTKPTSCKFLHGFHPRLLEGLPPHIANASRTKAIPIVSSPQGFNPYAPPPTYASNNDPGFASFSLPKQMPSWGNPLQSESIASSYSSGSSNLAAGPGGPVSFANIASRGHDKQRQMSSANDVSQGTTSTASAATIPTVRIPQDLWNPHENRDSSVFYIADPMERYRQVSMTNARDHRTDVIDLHFQSTKTFGVVLEQVLPSKLPQHAEGVWIVTGTGHHVGSKTHQKGGGALQSGVIQWLQDHGYKFAKGKDRNGLGGALLVTGVLQR
eukprot:Nitzschia sp. Nitz4//scaffold244_size29068//26118//28211//NITZ4_008068-RA/size29068-processed-gene-0.23-mRNA-1//-1//CDS//3329543868//8302//frame0